MEDHPFERVECPRCKKLLFRINGLENQDYSTIEIKCRKCKGFIRIDLKGKTQTLLTLLTERSLQ